MAFSSSKYHRLTIFLLPEGGMNFAFPSPSEEDKVRWKILSEEVFIPRLSLLDAAASESIHDLWSQTKHTNYILPLLLQLER